MGYEKSVARLMDEIEARVAHHERQEAYHAEQEVFHREERARHAAELEAARTRLTRFKEAAEAVVEITSRTRIPTAPQEDDLPPGASLRISQLAARIVATKGPDETFGGAAIAREINQRYGKKLRRPVQARNVAAALRRMAAAGRLRQLQEGRAHHEALYMRGEG